eukprot:Platyproteum_vivax@DN11437_c0_g1_i1.p1
MVRVEFTQDISIVFRLAFFFLFNSFVPFSWAITFLAYLYKEISFYSRWKRLYHKLDNHTCRDSAPTKEYSDAIKRQFVEHQTEADALWFLRYAFMGTNPTLVS